MYKPNYQLIYDIEPLRTWEIISSTKDGWNRVYRLMKLEFEKNRTRDLRINEKNRITKISCQEETDSK